MPSNAAFSFSTDRIPPGDREAIWREVIARQYMLLDVEPDDPASMHAEIVAHRLPSTVATFCTTPMRYRRTRSHSQARNADSFTLAVSLYGGFRFFNGGQQREFAAGDALLLHNENPGTIEVRSNRPTMTLRINGPMLRAVAGDIDERVATKLEGDNLPLKLAVGYLASIVQNDSSDPALDMIVNAHLVDLIAFALSPRGEARGPARDDAIQTARFTAIRDDILAGLGQRDLSAEILARRHGVSERYVYLLFERRGLSLGQYITEQRLKRALAMLIDPSRHQMKISDIAFAAGFADLTTFNRAFRRRYGDSPRDVRGGRKPNS